MTLPTMRAVHYLPLADQPQVSTFSIEGLKPEI